MIKYGSIGARVGTVFLATAVLAACAKPPPPPPPPPPPVVEVIPIRPLPPSGASYAMLIPPVGLDGKHQTVIRNLDADQRVWYFRSAWNVAALNCLGPEYQPILDGYRAFLKDNAKTLKATNERLERSFHKNHPTRGEAIKAREKLMTSVYNYFALPPARLPFCQAAMQVSALSMATPKPDIVSLANAHFGLFEAPFENFFTAYAQYQRDAAVWDARYGSRYGASQPGYVAVQAARASAALASPYNAASATLQPGVAAATVTDQETGAQIPVVPVTPQQQAVPIVQPVAKEPGKS